MLSLTMDLATHITTVLTPPLGANTADAVTRHLLAKHGVTAGAALDADTAYEQMTAVQV